MSPPAPISWGRKLLYSLVMLAMALGALELGLTALPYVWARAQWTPPPEGAQTWLIFTGDSVTAGFGLADRAYAYPGVLHEELVARGQAGFGVYSVARSASDVAAVSRQVQDALNVTPNGVHPVVLSMVGHNDLMSWSNTPAGDLAQEAHRQGPQNSGGGPRLLRLLRWFGSAVRNDVPHAEVLALWESDFAEALGHVKKRVEAAGGTYLLLTYLVPGVPDDPAMRPKVRVELEATRRAQLDVNEAIRRTATTLGVTLIDLGAADEQPSFDPNIFLDNIHLTVAGHARVARIVRDQLAMAGVLPANLFRARMASQR